FRIVQHGADKGACECRLAGAEITRKRDEISGAHLECNQLGEAGKPNLVDAVDNPGAAHATEMVFAASVPGRGPCSGKRTVTAVPSPGSLTRLMVPPCSSTRLLTIGRPRPAPRCLEPRLRDTKRPSTSRCWSCGIPAP